MALRLFGYGTLMGAEGFRQQLGERASGLRFRPARLLGWRRIWNAYREEWGGGVLNLERHPGGEVWGTLIDGLQDGDWAQLDAQEATHLPRESVWLELEDGTAVEAELYWQRRGSYAGAPSQRYQAVVLERAQGAGPLVLENLRSGTVNAAGEPQQL